MLWKSEVGPGWLWADGKTTCPPWHFRVCIGPPPAVLTGFAVLELFLMNVFMGVAVLGSWGVHPLSEPPDAAFPREAINSMYLGSPQALQQMWLIEASPIYLLSALEWALHGSQQKLRVLINLPDEAIPQQIIISLMFCEEQSEAKEMPLVGKLEVEIGPKVDEFCGTDLSLPPNIFTRVNLI